MARSSGLVSAAVRNHEENIINEMAEDCVKAVSEAYYTSTYIDGTGNLRDSYACAVFKDGVLLPTTMAFIDSASAVAPSIWYGKELYGRNEAVKYLSSYRPKAKGLSIVLIAAMPYYEILEKGLGNLHHKYKVITGANAFMRELARKYDGKFGGRRKQGTTLIRIEQ